MIKLSFPLCCLSEPHKTDRSTSLTMKQLFFVFNKEKVQNLTPAEVNIPHPRAFRVFFQQCTQLKMLHLQRVCYTTGTGHKWPERGLKNNESESFKHSVLSSVTLSPQTWPLSVIIAPPGPPSFLLIAVWVATSVFSLYSLNLDGSRLGESQEAPCWV